MFPNQNRVCPSPVPHTGHKPSTSHSFWLAGNVARMEPLTALNVRLYRATCQRVHDLLFSGFIAFVCRHSVRFELRRCDVSQSLYLDRTATQKQRRAGMHARFRCPVGSSKPRSQCYGGVRQYTAETVASFFRYRYWYHVGRVAQSV